MCPMHPEVVADHPGLCPKCNMKLELAPKAVEVRRAEGHAEAPTTRPLDQRLIGPIGGAFASGVT